MLNTRSMKGNTVHRHASVNQLRPACTQTDLRCTAASTKSQKLSSELSTLSPKTRTTNITSTYEFDNLVFAQTLAQDSLRSEEVFFGHVGR